MILTTLSFWLRNKAVPYTLLVLCLGTSLYSGQLLVSGLLLLIILFAALFLLFSGNVNRRWQIAGAFVSLPLFIVLAAHQAPGFEALRVLEHYPLSSSSPALNWSLKIDKPLAGLLLLLFVSGSLARSTATWRRIIRVALPLALIASLIVLGAGYGLGMTQVDIKWHSISLLWLAGNLFFTCVAEELFFRKLLQQPLSVRLQGIKGGPLIATLLVALLFGVAHFAGGVHYMLLASIAGFFYGYAFQLTGRVESSILVHFSLNAAHFILFAYPRAL